MSHTPSARENLLSMGASRLERQALLFLEQQHDRAASAGTTAAAAAAAAASTNATATAAESFVRTLAGPLQHMLLTFGLVEEAGCLPNGERLLFTALAVLATVAILAAEWRRRVRSLSRRLEEAEASVRYLNDKLHMSHPSSSSYPKKEIRIFMDGAFDLLHYGHMNAFRLARSLGTHLIVGLNSDESISECKGPPLMKDDERLTMVSACKFVDEVIPGCPYVMNREYLDYVIETYNVDYVVHGEDPCFVDGKDVYATAKQAGKFRTIPRTEGVSTTDIVGRMLLMTKEHHHFGQPQPSDASSAASPPSNTGHKSSDAASWAVHLGQQSKFLTTSRMLQLFSAGVKAPTKGMRVVYIDGAWDLFHPGHVSILKVARERGDYLIVGVHGDAVVNKVRGMNLPLMNLHERVLSVLGCRHVDDVLIDAPYEISEAMIDNLGISEVVRGRVSSDIGNHLVDPDERYRCAKERGIFTVIDSPSEFSMASIVRRIQRNQEAFQSRFERKMANETSFYREKRQSNGATCTNR